MNKPKIKDFLFLHAILLMYSLGGIFSKVASTKKFLSFEFLIYYGFVLLILVIYAVLWQQVLKKMPLNTAYANKSVVIIWGILWGRFVFLEKITVFMIVGAICILIGLTLVVTADE